MTLQYRKRSTEEYIILSISGASALCVLPLIFVRAFNADWYVAALDLIAVLATGTLFCYVFFTGKIHFARYIMAVLCVLLVSTTIVLKGSSQLPWIYPAIIGVFFLITPKTAATAIVGMVLFLLTYLWEQLSLLQATQLVITSLICIIYSYAFADRMRQQQKLLLELSTTDTLTEAGNRRAMENKLSEIIEQKLRFSNVHSALILMDLDEFKQINDQHGHAVGDGVLINFVKLIKDRIRSTDRLYRYGGEEFVAIIDNTDLNSSVKLAEQLRLAIEQASFPAKLQLTISVGVALYKKGETSFEWFGRADKAMYLAKESGRNLCKIAS